MYRCNDIVDVSQCAQFVFLVQIDSKKCACKNDIKCDVISQYISDLRLDRECCSDDGYINIF